MRSKKIERQIKKSFETRLDAEDMQRYANFIGQLPESPEKTNLQQIFNGFPAFLGMVDSSYEHSDNQVGMAQRSLELSSKELMDVNNSLSDINQTFDAMVNSLGQGFFLFGADGQVLSLCSKICESLLEGMPAGKSVADVMKVPEEKRATFLDWTAMLFQEVIDFDDLAIVGQKFFPHSGGRIVGLEYKPVRNKNGGIQAVVVIATDRTREIEADRKAQGMQAYATLVVAILKDRGRFRQYIMHSRRFFQEMHELLAMEVFSQDGLTLIKRHLHTLKGAAGTFGMIKLKEALHLVETDLSMQPDIKKAQIFLREAAFRCEKLFENILVENQDIIGDVIKDMKAIREVDLDSLNSFAGRLKVPNTSLDYIYDSFLNDILCVSLQNVLEQFDTLVQDTAKTLRKKVSLLQFAGEDLRILPERYGDVWESLQHLFRNLVDHGIESADVRKKLGKAEAGQVKVTCRQLQKGPTHMMEIKISDDGKGIDPEVIRQKLIKNGLKDATAMSDSELTEQIFEPGFSTAQQVTETSGRGVGLDALKSAIEEMGGGISVESVKGQGTTFVLVLPILNEPNYVSELAS